jgi:hypothetical protein
MRTSRLLAVVILGFLEAACLVQIDQVRDPSPQFEAARREALRVQGRKGPAHELNVLVYDEGDQKLVRVSVPMWLARKIASHADKDNDGEIDFGKDGDEAERAIRRHVRWKDVEKAGLGILVEVQDDDGAQVLVWLR